MPRSYAAALRERVLPACEQGEGSRAAIARRFRVGESTVSKWLQVARTEGRRRSQPHAGGPLPQLEAAGLQTLQEIVLDKADGTLAESGERLVARTGGRLGTASLCRALQKLPLTRKKTWHASEIEHPDIAAERENDKMNMKDMEANRLVFLDETGVKTQMSRMHARAEGGQRACGSVPCGHWRRVTILGALSLDGMLAAMTSEAATSAAVFLAYVQKVLIPTLLRLKPNAVIVMGASANAEGGTISPHINVKKSSKRSSMPHSNSVFCPAPHRISRPFEPCWSKVKASFREKGARSVEHLVQEAGPALDTITPSDARGCFLHCGYTI